MKSNENLYVALRAAFPADLDATAIETADGPGAPRFYTWRDLDRATAMIANLLDSLALPAGSRVAVQTEKSVEALMLYLGVLRAGYVYLPLNTAYQAAEIEYFIGNAEPAVVVCTPKNFAWVSKLAFKAGTKNVFTLDDDRSGSLLERAATHKRRARARAAQPRRPGRHPLHQRHHRAQQGRDAHARQPARNAKTLKDYWGWTAGDVLIHALPIFHVHGLFVASHGALLNGSKMIWFGKFDPRPRSRV
jgi:malonyl-CoA/methylmalonyl-CoA synthetase